MHLLRLSANKESFHEVVFQPRGLSLVVAEQKSQDSGPTATYNGVGKSLLLALLHYCLGSNRRKAFEAHLKGWAFSLHFDVAGKEHVITRAADKPSKITLDGKPKTLSGLRSYLSSICFEQEPAVPGLSFRSIIQKFIRSGRAAYNSFAFASQGDSRKPYNSMLRNAFLLGLDLDLARKKYELRKRAKSLNETMKKLQQEPLFAQLLAEETVGIELIALREQAAELASNQKSFKVADDYHDIERAANRIKRKLDHHRRETVKLEEAIAQVDRSLGARSDLTPERVVQIYEEAKVALPEKVRRRLEQISQFRKELQEKRLYRLTYERQQLNTELKAQQKHVESLSKELDDKLRYLSETRALDEYTAVSSELGELRQKIAKLEESNAIREKVDRELKNIERSRIEEDITTGDYLENSRTLIDSASAIFRGYARELYGSRPSGLTVANDDGDNQLRYRIDAHIRSDAAEGINEAKIFCFDMTALRLRRGHRIEFLAHDSTLFGPVDPRQRIAMFRIADRVCAELGVQYIATLNSHDISSMREDPQVDSEELDRLINGQSVVLRLTDASPEERLLGIDLDMDYTL